MSHAAKSLASRTMTYNRFAVHRFATTMAAVCKEIGPLNPATHCVYESVELPAAPPPGHVRVKVAGSGINFAEILQMQGKYQEAAAAPFVPGNEAAGEIIALGAGAAGKGGGAPADLSAPSALHPAGLRVGDRALLLPRGGAYAREVDVAVEACFPLPRDDPRAAAVDLTEGAALMIAYGTAHLALTRRAQLRAGETVLVTAAAGGVGLACVEVRAPSSFARRSEDRRSSRTPRGGSSSETTRRRARRTTAFDGG